MSRTAKDAVVTSTAGTTADPVSGDVKNLLHFATRTDIFLIVVGSICKAAYGVLGVAILIIFADFFDATGRDPMEVGRSIFYQFLLFGGMAFVLEATDTIFYEVAKHRMMAEWKKEYVMSILRQDVGWYDVNRPQELATRMGEAIVKIEKGLSTT